MKIIFRADASSNIGTGHLSRCMTLADAFSTRGCQITFICRDLDLLYAAQIRRSGYALLNLTSSIPHTKSSYEQLPHSHWLPVSQIEDAEAILAAIDEEWDLTIVDHYALDTIWEQRIRGKCARILVIDDLADRVHDCDFLLDQNLQPSTRNRYIGLTSSKCEFLIGTQFALLRPEFARWALKNIRCDDRLNIFFGGVDQDGATMLALQSIKSLPHMQADVIVGNANPSLKMISAMCAPMERIHLHIQATNMAELFSQARLAVGAGGATSWERCCVGLPALVASLAQNQTQNCSLLELAGVAVNLGLFQELSSETLISAIHSLIKDPGRLDKMGERAKALVDGNGTTKVVNTVLHFAGATP